MKRGEGVFGLWRAFALAGARTLLISLWKAPDLATAILMEQLYRNLTIDRPRDEPLRQAQQYVQCVTVGMLKARSG